MARGVLPTKTFTSAIILTVVVVLCVIKDCVSTCPRFPKEYAGSWYHRDTGSDTNVLIDPAKSLWTATIDKQGPVSLQCVGLHMHPFRANVRTQDGFAGPDTTMLLKSLEGKGQNCFVCLDVIYRSDNILQFKKSDCLTKAELDKCPGVTKLPSHDQLVTMFNKVITPTDCISSIEGRFQFSYEVSTGGGGICNSSQSILEACQNPSSPAYDNKDFRMYYSPCKDLGYKRTIRYKCLGTWVATVSANTYTFVALANDVDGSLQEQYKCLITQKDQHSDDNTIRWGMSRYGDCRQLTNPDGSPYQIVLRRVAPVTDFLTPQCRLPQNLTGLWFTQGKQFASDVWINETHIKYTTKKDQYDYEVTWFTCQAMQDTRYLMSKIVVGRCEINYVCYDIVPRHHSIVRYRVGRPVRLKPLNSGGYAMENQVDIFREACSWQWLTFARDNVDWKYEVLIQNPPTPITCPIGGRYYFTQYSKDFYQLYDTRIRGVTDRPRVRINCKDDVKEVKSCVADSSRIEVDASYCETVDYRGRPIGEYEEPDHYLTCAGYWLEDMKSYLITYDEEDAISRFRCWVYERISWTQIAMSRAETARCPRNMTSTSYLTNGARFYMELSEQERLFDECPPRFDSGIDPSILPFSLYRLDDAHAWAISPNGMLVAFLLILLHFWISLR